MDQITELNQITAHFQIPGELVLAERFDRGHINDTYLVRFDQGDGPVEEYILQRINHFVFKQPLEVMANIEAVLGHLRYKIEAAGGDPSREVLTLIPTHEHGYLYISADQCYWRVYARIRDARTYQTPASQAHVYHAGMAFGDFQRLLDDFPSDSLHETIVDFHNTPVRYQAFLAAVEADVHRRAASAVAEIDFVRRRAGEVGVIVEALAAGEVPLRVTHNDTKFDNVMIDDHSGEAVCIVDLDTVMPGSLLFDFGDAIRSIANTGAEDEPDLEKVHFDLETYENFARGYLEALGITVTPGEFSLLPFSARLMTLECGIRFLTDYLIGDEYFRTSREGHNLDRCRTQFRLVEEMEEQFSEMKRIVQKYSMGEFRIDDFIG